MSKIRDYMIMIKPYQTLMLMLTGLVGYLTVWDVKIWELVSLLFTMLLTIGGATLFNMWYDSDIDSVMDRTKRRPLPSGRVSRKEVLVVSILVSVIGLIWSFLLNFLYGIVALIGFFFNAVVYTLWTKRRTPWSIIWGGIAGAMPILGGRVLATGRIDTLGLLMSLIILLWVPIHNITFEVKYREDYAKANVPVLPNVYGVRLSMYLIPVFIFLNYVAIALTAWFLRAGFLPFLILTAAFIFFFLISVAYVRTPEDRRTLLLFKLASAYMFLTMVGIVLS